ncbi:MAG: hypothetical protein KDC95_03515 [Planctomycetes bacterium]|nr:hypothetical protein [Planctomycetota bacterium]
MTDVVLNVPGEALAAREGPTSLDNWPVPIEVPDFDVTLANCNMDEAVDGQWRPIGAKMPWPEREDGSFIFRENDPMIVRAGSQIGSAILGERLGRRLRRVHIRGISLAAGEMLEGVQLSRGSLAGAPRFLSASDGLADIDAADIRFHCGTREYTISNWQQAESSEGRHKWHGGAFDSPSGGHWIVRSYRWPGLSRTTMTAAFVWHDQRTTALTTQLPEIFISVPAGNVANSAIVRAEYGLWRDLKPTFRTINGVLRQVIRLVPDNTKLGDAQALRLTFTVMPVSASTSELTDFENGAYYPVKALADPDFFQGRVGAFDDWWPLRNEWGTEGREFLAHRWDASSEFGFLGYLANRTTATIFSRPRNTNYLDPRSSGGKEAFGNTHLTELLGVGRGNPRMLWELGYSAIFETLRPLNYVHWTKDSQGSRTPTSRFWRAEDHPYDGPGQVYMYSMRDHLTVTKNIGDAEHFGKDPFGSLYNPYQHSNPTELMTWDPAHCEAVMIPTLAMLDDIDDHWVDLSELIASCYLHERSVSQDHQNVSARPYRSGRYEMTSAWCYEVVDDALRDALERRIEDRFDQDLKGPYQEFWDHVRNGHAWTHWDAESGNDPRHCFNEFSSTWFFARGLPGYYLAARIVRRKRHNVMPMIFCALAAQWWLRTCWRLRNGIPAAAYFMHYPGKRTDQNESYLYGQNPPENWYDDPKRVLFTDIFGSSLNPSWALGAVQAATDLCRDFLGDEATASIGDVIETYLAGVLPSHTSNVYTHKLDAAFLIPENHAARAILAPTKFVDVAGESLAMADGNVRVGGIPTQGEKIAFREGDLEILRYTDRVLELPGETIAPREGVSIRQVDTFPVAPTTISVLGEAMVAREGPLRLRVGDRLQLSVAGEAMGLGDAGVELGLPPTLLQIDVPGEGMAPRDARSKVDRPTNRVLNVTGEAMSLREGGGSTTGSGGRAFLERVGAWEEWIDRTARTNMTATDQVIPYYVKRETTQVRVTVRDVTGFLFDTSTIDGAT